MYITLDILQKRGACQDALDFFAKHYPNGAEMLYFIEKAHLPIHFLHWGYQWLDPNEEEIAAYWKRVDVVDSEGVFESEHILNSLLVSKSTRINTCQEIYNSEDITQSQYVVGSQFVDESTNIGTSSFVNNSYAILLSKNIENSTEVLESTNIYNSKGIFQSNDILNGHSVWKSTNLTDCSFCFECANLKNSLFCIQQNDNEYLLFNKPIDKSRFEIIYKQYQKYASFYITLTTGWNVHNGDLPIKIYDYRKHTGEITESFWKWVETLPGYDSQILYSLTFNSRFLR